MGPHIDVAAPGTNVVSTNFNNGYIDQSGTSMATPHVSGLASLLKGFNTNLANDDIEQIIRLTADDLLPAGFDNAFGAGRINAQRALQRLQAPNTIQQLNVRGGTVFSTSASMTRTFLGVPGFADANYTVKRSEVRVNITFPPMCTIAAVWGRGVGTSGYREEQGRCFGEGICEVVPGTQTNTGATLRTWIYEVWSISGQYYGFYPASAGNVVFQYSVLGTPSPVISGPTTIYISAVYNVTGLPAGGGVSGWSPTPATGVVNLAPSGSSVTATKTGNGYLTLTATLSGCTNINTITKTSIRVGGFSSSDYPVSGPSSSCSNSNVYFSTNQLQGATNYNWFWPGDWTYISGQGTNSLSLRTGSSSGSVGVRVANQCDAGGSPGTLYVQINNCGFSITASPNPATDEVTVTTEESSTMSKTKTNTVKNKIYQIEIVDQYGNIRKKFSYAGGVTNTKVNVSNLVSGTYIIHAYNGKVYGDKKVVIVH